ncbi:MAG: response regulator [Vicinamibacteria bacterium]|nr:response regulator [Vicinamibacteria bacterium]
MNPNADPRQSRRRRVLVVEDEEEVRILVGRILQSAGHIVDMVSEGAAALRRIKTEPPDLIILDIMMPGIDGWTILEQLRKMSGAPPIVVLTGLDDADSFRKGIGGGGTAYVIKPFRFHELLATCQRALLTASQSREVVVERRRQTRRMLIVEVSVLSRENRPFALGELLNLSLNGACIELGIPLDVGERVRVSFNIPRGQSPHLEGDVRWRRETARGVMHGLAFVHVSPQDGEYLRELLPARE